MNVQFEKKELEYLQNILTQVQTLEQTQELRIPEGMPAAARILGAWGQILLRSKEWSSGTVQISGGVMAWVLYEPENATGLQRLESWIPFRMDWDIREGTSDGKVRIYPVLRSMDARMISDGKVLIRAGIAVQADCWTSNSCFVSEPGKIPEEVEVLRSSWPVRLPKEAGEKSFVMEDTLTLPPSAPRVSNILYCTMTPEITDQKVLGNKLVFRGNGNLHMLYSCEDGQLHNWNFELPFSQYSELETGYSQDAQADVQVAVTQLELEPDGEGKVNLKAGMTGQYLIDDRQMLEMAEDAYGLWQEVSVHREELLLPLRLDSRREVVSGDQMLPVQADLVADCSFLTDFPRQRREGEKILLEQPGMIHLLYYDREGKLQTLSRRWQGSIAVAADETARLTMLPLLPQTQLLPGAEEITFRGEVPVQVTAAAGRGLPMVTGMEIGTRKTPDPSRPSVILCRTGNSRVWDIARKSGSTPDVIREVNGFQGEPDPGQLLLIPVL